MSNTIDSLSSGLLQNYINYSSKSSLSTDDMFRAVSLQVGGDGKTITKDQLDKYIKGADSNTADLNELKIMQNSWDTISSDSDSITSSNMKDYSKLLFSAVTSTVSQSLNENPSSVMSKETSLSGSDKIYSYLIDSATNGSGSTSSTQYDLLTSQLNELLSNNSEDNNNSDQIDMIVNLIGNMQQASLSTVSFTI